MGRQRRFLTVEEATAIGLRSAIGRLDADIATLEAQRGDLLLQREALAAAAAVSGQG